MEYIPNAFQIHNGIVDDFICILSHSELKCYLAVIRKTTGWGKEIDSIPVSQLHMITGIKKRDTIFKAMKNLEKYGLISVSHVPGKWTKYSPKIPTGSPTQRDGGSPTQRDGGSPTQRDGGSPTQRDTSKPTNSKPTNSKEKEKEKVEIKPIQEWIDYRKSIKKPIAEASIEKLYKRYERDPNLFMLSVEYSIENGYQGLFEPKSIQPTGDHRAKQKEAIAKAMAELNGDNEVIDAVID